MLTLIEDAFDSFLKEDDGQAIVPVFRAVGARGTAAIAEADQQPAALAPARCLQAQPAMLYRGLRAESPQGHVATSECQRRRRGLASLLRGSSTSCHSLAAQFQPQRRGLRGKTTSVDMQHFVPVVVLAAHGRGALHYMGRGSGMGTHANAHEQRQRG